MDTVSIATLGQENMATTSEDLYLQYIKFLVLSLYIQYCAVNLC